MKLEWMARDTDEKTRNIDNFRTTKTDPRPVVQQIIQDGALVSELKTKYPNVKSWGAIGYCWGGKIVALSSGERTPFTCAVQTSPSRINPEDATAIKIPMAVLASKGEDPAKIREFSDFLKGPKYVETWSNSVHGWMSARYGTPLST